MKLSVVIQTYNHEKYITQAIESALMQKTEFDFEILVGEDDSSDRTREIVIAYKKKYPEKIRLFLNDRKDVIYIDGKPTGRWNLVNLINNARGDYIAWLDGDDYWTSPYKLQKQVDFLDENPGCTSSFHNVEVCYEDEYKSPHPLLNIPEQIFTLEDIVCIDFIPTCSDMFRARLFQKFPDWFYTLRSGDWPLHILNAMHGNIGYINDILGVYRKHSGGVWSSMSRLEALKLSIHMSKIIKNNVDPKYEKNINKQIAEWNNEIEILLCSEHRIFELLIQRFKSYNIPYYDFAENQTFWSFISNDYRISNSLIIKLLMEKYTPLFHKYLRKAIKILSI